MKWAGLFLVFAAPAAAGYFLSARVKRQVLFMENFCNLLSYVKFEIETFSRRQRDIFSSYKSDFFQKNGLLDAVCGKGLRAALEENREFLCLPENFRQVALSFAADFGRVSKERESERMEKCIRRLEEISTGSRAELENKMKLCRRMGLLAGIFAVIILI